MKRPELIFIGAGLFAISAQLILYRIFLTVFSGNELSTGLFLFSWLIWTGIGALAASSTKIRGIIFSFASFETLVLLYIPAFIIQYFLLSNASEILGVKFYQQIPLTQLLLFVMFFNSPLSFIMGFLFPLGCEWAKDSFLPVTRVYLFEAFGAFYGAVFSTIVLSYGISGEFLFLIIVEKFTLFILVYHLWGFKKIKLLPFGILVLSIIFAFSGYSEKWASFSSAASWKTVLPGAEYLGSFNTAQARYSYGKYGGRFIVEAWRNVLESFPGGQQAAEKISSDFAQKPDARNILVVGNAPLALASKIAELPSVKKVSVICTDPEYPEKLFFRLPQEYMSFSGKLEMPKLDLKKYLSAKGRGFDLVIMDCGLPASLAVNRFYSEGCFELIKKSLNEGGVLSVSFAGGDNYIGPELAYFGASLFETLKSVFPEIALKPGDSSIFYCCLQKGRLSENPEILAKRLEILNVKERAFLTGNISAMYPQDRIIFQKNIYGDLANVSLLNTDSNPRTFLYAMLFTAKRLGNWTMPKEATIVRLSKFLPLYTAVLFIIIWFCRLFYLLPVRRKRQWRSFEIVSMMTLFSISAMLLDILLIFNYQMEHGSIFLYFGLASSLFMLGIFSGGTISRKLSGEYFIPILGAGLSVSALILYFSGPLPIVVYGIFFFICGLFPGASLSFCALKFKEAGISDAKAGVVLVSADCIGGAFAGLSAALLLLPFSGTFGIFVSVQAMACYVIGASLLFPMLNGRKGIAKGLFFILFGTVVFVIIITVNNGKTKAIETRIKTIPLDNL